MKTDLTKGSITKGILLFSLPLMEGNLLQQLYNIVDTVVVGKDVGSHSQCFCAGRVCFGGNDGTCLCRASGCDPVDEYSGGGRAGYFRVSVRCTGGTCFYVSVSFYCRGTSECRKFGGTAFFLFGSTILNIGLDLLFVAFFSMGCFGAALATVLAQGAAALGIFFYRLLKERERVRKGIRTAFMLSILFCAVVSPFVNVFAEPLLGLFLDREDRAILEIGILFLFYAIFRGLERPGISVILTVISLGLRVVLAYLAAPIWGLDAVWAAVPIGWIVADLAGFGFYFIVQKQLSHIAAE